MQEKIDGKLYEWLTELQEKPMILKEVTPVFG